MNVPQQAVYNCSRPPIIQPLSCEFQSQAIRWMSLCNSDGLNWQLQWQLSTTPLLAQRHSNCPTRKMATLSYLLQEHRTCLTVALPSPSPLLHNACYHHHLLLITEWQPVTKQLARPTLNSQPAIPHLVPMLSKTLEHLLIVHQPARQASPSSLVKLAEHSTSCCYTHHCHSKAFPGVSQVELKLVHSHNFSEWLGSAETTHLDLV